MRTVDATLKTALATGHFVPYFKLRVYRNRSLLDTLQVMKYKLTGTHLSITVRGMVVVSTAPDAVKVILDRGITSQGTNYILSSSKFSPIKGTIEYLGFPKYMAITTTLEASLVPPKPISFAGDVSYHDAITSFCTAIGKTAVFKVPGAAYWGYKFLPAGRTVTFNDANRFLPLLRQKYFIFACDNGNEEILFYQAFDPPVNPDAQLTSLLSEIGTGYFQRRRFMARDEAGSIRYAGTAGDAIHNLGYLESTASMPSSYDQRQPISVRWQINLDYQDGDYQRVDDSYDVFPLEVTEIFDPKASPGWCTVGAQTEYFANTEGGALPSTIERVSNYTPLNVSTFNKNLDSSVNNVQALAERVDDMNLGGRTLLVADLTYYVRPNGNDSNAGLINDDAHAFKTIQHAYDVIAGTLDLGGHNVTIQVADGTYTAGLSIATPWTGGGTVSLVGNTSTPANAYLSITSNNCLTCSATLPGVFTINGFKLHTITSGHGIVHAGVGTINFGNIEFAALAAGGIGLFAYSPGAKLQAITNYLISGGAGYHMYTINGGVISIVAKTITLTGSPAFSYFALASRLSEQEVYANTYSGAASAGTTRYYVSENSVIFVNGGGAAYLPGGIAGTAASGGQYT